MIKNLLIVGLAGFVGYLYISGQLTKFPPILDGPKQVITKFIMYPTPFPTISPTPTVTDETNCQALSDLTKKYCK